MILRLFAAFFLMLSSTLIAQAQSIPISDRILDAVRLGELLQIMSEESQRHGATLDTTMLGGRGGVGWERIVQNIHDPNDWETRLRRAVDEGLDQSVAPAILSFFNSAQGQRIVELELAARRAMLDDLVEAASQEELARLEAEGAPRFRQLERFVDVNDLIDANVVGAMNANIAFLDGLSDGSGKPAAEDPVVNAWRQEPDIRASTTEWVYSFTALAYKPLSNSDLDAYIAFSESAAGHAFNNALFAAFDTMFAETSYATGRALGQLALSEEL